MRRSEAEGRRPGADEAPGIRGRVVPRGGIRAQPGDVAPERSTVLATLNENGPAGQGLAGAGPMFRSVLPSRRRSRSGSAPELSLNGNSYIQAAVRDRPLSLSLADRIDLKVTTCPGTARIVADARLVFTMNLVRELSARTIAGPTFPYASPAVIYNEWHQVSPVVPLIRKRPDVLSRRDQRPINIFSAAHIDATCPSVLL